MGLWVLGLLIIPFLLISIGIIGIIKKIKSNKIPIFHGFILILGIGMLIGFLVDVILDL